jgi:phenylacetate-CoA ligase
MQPTLIRKLIFPLHERIFNRPTFSYLKDLEKTQWLPRDELERLQLKKLGQLLRLAARHCPWHAENIRKARLELSEQAPPLTLNDFRRLPTMTRADAQEHGDRMVWRGVPGGAYRYNTGGSSGQPLIFYYGRKRQAADAASRIRARRWWSVELGEREVFLWGSPVELNKTDQIKRVRDRLINQLLLNAFAMSEANMEKYLDAIQGFEPACIYGYASSLALLAAFASRRSDELRLPCLKVVCTTGEPLYPHQRTLIQRVFKAPVANEFGSRDSGLIAHESPDGQMLMMSESILLEVVDSNGNPTPPGQIGEAVITGLCSDAQPFVRYRTGDMVRLSDAPCKSGRGLHVIDEVLGRKTDFITRSDGTIMHALSVIYVLRAAEGVGEFKLVQHSYKEFEVQLVPNSKWRRESGHSIVQQLKARLGQEVEIELRLLDSIPAESSGKYRYVVSHVALPADLDAPSITGSQDQPIIQ